MDATNEFLCMYCGASLQTRSGFNRHKRAHENTAPYRCCGKLFFDRTRLRMHRCSCHGEPEQEVCDVCGATFASKQQVKQHTRLVHSDQTFKCDICGQEFKSKRSLKDHVNKHNGAKAYTCQCGRSYQYASGLNRHKIACKN